MYFKSKELKPPVGTNRDATWQRDIILTGLLLLANHLGKWKA